jgi:methylthioribose-1-phosphate isomerase
MATSETRVANPAFDITEARLIAGFITERGLVAPSALLGTFTDRNP